MNGKYGNRIKICGLRREEDIRFANAVQPDFVGFVFAPSRREVSLEKAAQLRRLLKPEIPAAGVFVNASPEEILEPVKRKIIQMIQLHGQEDKDFIKYIKSRTSLPIIKAVSIKTREDVQNCRRLAADYLLFDQGSGGTGKTFDWSLLCGENHQEKGAFHQMIGKPFFLAGGISESNVEEAITCFHPYAVDVSSSVETDGVKDFEKMKRLTELVHGI